jgi:hypothetical protein
VMRDLPRSNQAFERLVIGIGDLRLDLLQL